MKDSETASLKIPDSRNEDCCVDFLHALVKGLLLFLILLSIVIVCVDTTRDKAVRNFGYKFDDCFTGYHRDNNNNNKNNNNNNNNNDNNNNCNSNKGGRLSRRISWTPPSLLIKIFKRPDCVKRFYYSTFFRPSPRR